MLKHIKILLFVSAIGIQGTNVFVNDAQLFKRRYEHTIFSGGV